MQIVIEDTSCGGSGVARVKSVTVTGDAQASGIVMSIVVAIAFSIVTVSTMTDYYCSYYYHYYSYYNYDYMYCYSHFSHTGCYQQVTMARGKVKHIYDFSASVDWVVDMEELESDVTGSYQVTTYFGISVLCATCMVEIIA